MCSFRTNPRRLVFPIAVLCIGVPVALAQKGSPSPSPGAGSNAPTNSPGSNIGGPTRGTTSPTSPFPGANSPSTPSPWETRPLFLSGRVMLDDGSQPNNQIRIERVCGGNPKLEGHTDSKGRFSIQLDSQLVVDTDAADASMGGMGPGGPGGPGSGQSPMSNAGRFGGRDSFNRYWNCELRASYPGYRSDYIELSTRRSLDDPNVGTIVLHHLGSSQGSTISLTTALAPKHAQKEYEKGTQLAQKGKFEEAEKHLTAATDTYPKYAIAWFALGQVEQRKGRAADAQKSYQAAIAADPKFVSPYDQLALLSVQGSRWEEAANFSKQAMSLDPEEFPSSLWYNAYANYKLKKPDDAVKSAQDLVKRDTAHHYPQAERLLTQIYLEKGQYPEAATHLRNYLALDPHAQDADALRQMLLKIQQASNQKP